MNNRLELQTILEDFIGNRHVYYQPPETLKMEYPAIVYSKSNIQKVSADDSAYTLYKRYEIIVIDKKPDNEAIDKLLAMPLSSFDRHYKAENLNHDVITLYY